MVELPHHSMTAPTRGCISVLYIPWLDAFWCFEFHRTPLTADGLKIVKLSLEIGRNFLGIGELGLNTFNSLFEPRETILPDEKNLSVTDESLNVLTISEFNMQAPL